MRGGTIKKTYAVRRENYVWSRNYAEPRSSLQSALRSALWSAFWKIPNFEKSSWIFFHLKNTVQTTPSHGRLYSLRYVPCYGLRTEKFPMMKNQVGFLSTLKGFWFFLLKYSGSICFKLIMTEVSKNLRKYIFSLNTPDFESWSRIFVRQKEFFADFRNCGKFISPEVYF